MTEIKLGTKTVIDTDDDFFVSVVTGINATVSVAFTTGSAGSFVIKDSDNKPYRDGTNANDLAVAFNSTLTKHVVAPTGGHVNLTSTGMVGGSASAIVRVTQAKNR